MSISHHPKTSVPHHAMVDSRAAGQVNSSSDVTSLPSHTNSIISIVSDGDNPSQCYLHRCHTVLSGMTSHNPHYWVMSALHNQIHLRGTCPTKLSYAWASLILEPTHSAQSKWVIPSPIQICLHPCKHKPTTPTALERKKLKHMIIYCIWSYLATPIRSLYCLTRLSFLAIISLHEAIFWHLYPAPNHSAHLKCAHVPTATHYTHISAWCW